MEVKKWIEYIEYEPDLETTASMATQAIMEYGPKMEKMIVEPTMITIHLIEELK